LGKNLPIQFERKFRTTLGCILGNLFFIMFTVGREKKKVKKVMKVIRDETDDRDEERRDKLTQQ
jgi:hypothetical protein